jgi:hypothetical protein
MEYMPTPAGASMAHAITGVTVAEMNVDYWWFIKGALPLLWMFWPLWALAFVVGLLRLGLELFELKIEHWRIARKFRAGEQWRSDRDTLQWLRGMKPSEFEDYVADLFRSMGYDADAVGGSHDGGFDVVARKNGITHYIQCKKFISSAVSVGAVRDFYGALADKLANGKGYIVTTNTFSLEAEKFAEDKPIELIDGHRLIEHVHLAHGRALEGNSAARRCPVCGGELVDRFGRFGKFVGCDNYPKCTFTEGSMPASAGTEAAR